MAEYERLQAAYAALDGPTTDGVTGGLVAAREGDSPPALVAGERVRGRGAPVRGLRAVRKRRNADRNSVILLP
jgi:hypothetical protein